MERYRRQLGVPWIGTKGQQALKRSSAVIIGCGGLGCACSTFLARAGIGRIRLIDCDIICLSDVHRQIHYDESHAQGLHLKVSVAAQRLRDANSETRVEAFAYEFNPQNSYHLVEDFDLIIDCSDNFATRFLINEVALKHGIPWVHGACSSTSGLVVSFKDGSAACYRCIMAGVSHHLVTSSNSPPILGPVAGAVGCIEAIEAMRLLIDPKLTKQRMIHFDATRYLWETIEVRKRADCPTCAKGQFEILDGLTVWQRSSRNLEGVIEVETGSHLDMRILKERLGRQVREIANGAVAFEKEGVSFIILAEGRAYVRGVSQREDAEQRVHELLENNPSS